MEYKLRCPPVFCALALTALVGYLPGPLCAQVQTPATDPSPAASAPARDPLDAWLSKFAPAFTGAPDASLRYLLHVEVPEVLIYEKPDATAVVVGRLEQGIEVEADQKTGDWYRIRRVSGEYGWVLNAPVVSGTLIPGPFARPTPGVVESTGATGTLMLVRPFPTDRRIAYETGAADPRVPQSLPPDKPAEQAGTAEEARIARQRPQGTTIEPRLPLIDPSRVEAPSPLYRSEEIPIRDRWRIVKSLGLLPYKPLDPYNPNVLKGDLPVLESVLGKDWFFNLAAVSDTLVEARRLPTPTGAQSTLNPGSNFTFGRGRQTTLAETGIVSLSLIKGDTTFRPPDYEFRFVPVFNFNRTMTQEVRAININPGNGQDRNDNFFGVQELFVDKHLRDVSTRFDFDSLRVGIQPFTADFRGFLFLDQPFGVRLFGTRDNNKWQYNAAWFRRLEKDTNSGLNDVGRRMRADDIFVFNAYRQDSFSILGFTSQGIILHNRNREGDRPDFYNVNGFLERPAVFGTGRPHNYDVTYLGYNADGHIGKWNITASAYYALGHDDRGMLSGRREKIGATFGALEISRDFDWIRVRASGLYASGDKDPYDGKAQGFDAVLENPQFAGADTSYWIRQAVPLIGGGGVALSMRNGVLPSLRSSREFGQSNFTNPGLRLLGVGADFDVKPGVRVISNVNYLAFENLSSLAVLRNQRLSSTKIGIDVSAGVQYRPFFTQNVVINASVGALFPGKGLREIYGNAFDSIQYSALVNVLLTF